MSKPNPLADYITSSINHFLTIHSWVSLTIRCFLMLISMMMVFNVTGACSKFPNDFAAAATRMLPRDVEFIIRPPPEQTFAFKL